MGAYNMGECLQFDVEICYSHPWIPYETVECAVAVGDEWILKHVNLYLTQIVPLVAMVTRSQLQEGNIGDAVLLQRV